MPGDYAQATIQLVTLKRRVINILKSPTTGKIDFYLGSMHVTGAGYLRVADAISVDKIGVRIGMVPAGAAASFQPWVFDFPNGQYGALPSDQATIVHEATHAMKALTLSFAGLVPDTQNEAAAYVAEALYMRYLGSSVGNGLPQWVRADLIAKSIMGQPGAIVPKTDEDNLRVLVAMRPVYFQSGITYSSTKYR
jgi:hypothetical protein